MNKKLNLSALLNEEFVPLEESKEGMLKGGFAELSDVANNCDCNTIPNNCECEGNPCNTPPSSLNSNCTCSDGSAVNNCDCKTYAPKESSTEDGSTAPSVL